MAPSREEAARLLKLARRDEAAFLALLGVPEVGVTVAFFHAQQAVEKALKAAMCLHALEYRRTHDLEELAALLADAGHPARVPEADLRLLTPYAVQYRYDDDAPELLSSAQAQAIVKAVLSWSAEQLQTSARR